MHQCWSFLYVAIKMAILTLIAVYLFLVIKPLFFVQISAHRITIDLSYKMDSKVMKWVSARPYELRIMNRDKIFSNRTIRIQSDEVFMATHTGTHLDAPIHFGGKNRWAVADIPLKNLIDRPLILVDAVDQAESTRDYLVTTEDLQQFEEVYGEIPEESVVILRTGWSKFWPNKLDYFGTDTNDERLLHFPGLHPDAAKWLVDQRKIVGVGIDGPSIDCGQCDAKMAHVTLNENNIYILENVEKSVFKLPNVGSTITVLPLKLTDASGCPVRPIAQYSHEHADTNGVSNLNGKSKLTLILTMIMIWFTLN